MAAKRRSSSSRNRGREKNNIRSEINTNQNMSRRQKSRKRKQMKYNKHQRMIFVGIMAAVLVLACVIGFATRRNGSEIFLNGTSAGIVKTRNITQEDLENSLAAMLAENIGTNTRILDQIDIKGVHVTKKSKAVTVEEMLAKLKNNVKYELEAYAITVDGEVAAALKNEAEAKEVLEYLNTQYIPEGVEGATVTYVQDVKIVSDFIETNQLMSVDAAKQKMAHGDGSPKTCVIEEGQSLYSIATRYNMSMNELLSLNPDLSVTSKIYVGENITVKNNEPVITVRAAVTTTETETAEKEIEYQYDNTKNKSYKKIIQQGKAGVTEVKKEKVYINGHFDSENVVSSRVITQPVKEIVCVGTN